MKLVCIGAKGTPNKICVCGFFSKWESWERAQRRSLIKEKDKQKSILVIDPTVSLKIGHILRSKQTHRQKSCKQQFLKSSISIRKLIAFFMNANPPHYSYNTPKCLS